MSRGNHKIRVYLTIFIVGALIVISNSLYRSMSRATLNAKQLSQASPTPVVVAVEPYEAQDTPYPTLTPRPTPIPFSGITATPYPIRKTAEDPSGSIYFVSDNESAVSFIPIDAQGMKSSDAQSWPVEGLPTFFLGPGSPDGRYNLLLRSVEPAARIYAFDNLTQEMWPLFQNQPHAEQWIGWPYGWHPDGRRVFLYDPDNQRILLVDIETGKLIIPALTSGPVLRAAISPDGQWVAYVDMKDGNELLFLASTVRSDAHPAYSDGYIAASSVYDWSPDGEKLLFSGDPRRFNAGLSNVYPDPEMGPLWIYDLDDQSFQPLDVPFGMGNNFGSPWSPDGQWIAGTAISEGRPADCMEKQMQSDPNCFYDQTISIANVESGEVRRLATGIQPVWSPDGSILAFVSNTSGSPEIWTVRIDGSHLTQLTNGAAPRDRIVWAEEAK